MSDEDPSESDSAQQADPNASPPDPACPPLDEARELRIRQSLAACFDIGILLSTLDFQLRFAYLAWNPDTFQAATATWRQLSLKVQEAVAEPAHQDELREIVGKFERNLNESFFSESHAEHLDDVLRDTRASGWYSSATDEQICQDACRSAYPFRAFASQLLREIERCFSEAQVAFLRLGLLVDEGTHSDDIPLDVFDLPSSAVPICQDDLPSSPNSKGWGKMTSDASDPQKDAPYYLPRRIPDEAPPHDQDRWIEEVKNRCRLIRRDFPSSRPEAFDVTLDHQASVEQIANAIRKAIKDAVDTGSATVDDEEDPPDQSEDDPTAGYLGITLYPDGRVTRKGHGEIKLDPNRQMYKILKLLHDRGAARVVLNDFQSKWQRLGGNASPKRDTVYQALATLSGELIALEVQVKGKQNLGWTLEDLSPQQHSGKNAKS